MKYFNRKPTKTINKPDLSKLDNLFNQLPDNFAPTPKTKVSPMKSKVHTPILESLVAAKAAGKPSPIQQASAEATADLSSRVAQEVLKLLQKALPSPAGGLHGLLEKARATHDIAFKAAEKKQDAGLKRLAGSQQLTGLARLIQASKDKASK